MGFLVLIEQGPVLEIENAALGVVTGICGIERNTVCFYGDTGMLAWFQWQTEKMHSWQPQNLSVP